VPSFVLSLLTEAIPIQVQTASFIGGKTIGSDLVWVYRIGHTLA
jgi:hypothetical protein